MAASSSEESLRDDRRGPDEEVVKAGDVPAGTVEGAACLHAAAGDAEPAEKKKVEDEDRQDGAKSKKDAKHKPGGARKNWHRKDGDDDTWTCPDCNRVIKDHPASKDQHRVSAHCFAHRLWNAHAFSTWPLCEQYGKEWASGPDRFEIRGSRFCQVKPPPEYWLRQRSPPPPPPVRRGTHDAGYRSTRNRGRESLSEERRRSRRERSRSRSARHRLRSRGSARAVRCARSADRRRREKRRQSSDSDSKETVVVDDEEQELRPHRSKTVVPSTASKGNRGAAKTDKSQQKETSKKPRLSSSGKDGNSEAKVSKSSGKADKDSSDEYTYTSSPEEEQKKPLVAAKSAAVPAAKAGGTAPAGVAKAAQKDFDRRLEYMNSLLKTAMETAARFQH